MNTARKQKAAPRSNPKGDHFSARQAAEILGCDRSAVLTYALKGRIKTTTFADRVFYEAESVYALLAELEQERSSKS